MKFFIILSVIVAVNAVPKIYTDKKALTDDLKHHCDTICKETAEGIPEFNDKYKTCICYIGKHVDDLDITLMRKNAKSLGLSLKTINSLPNRVQKREADQQLEENEPTPKPGKKKLLFPKKLTFKHFPKPEPIIPDAIVGRANPASAPPKPQLQPIAVKDILLKARNRIDHLIKHSEGDRFNARFAASETQAIRNALKTITRNKPSETVPKVAAGLHQHQHAPLIPKARTPLIPKVEVPQGLKKPLDAFKNHRAAIVAPRMKPMGVLGSSGPKEEGTSTTEKVAPAPPVKEVEVPPMKNMSPPGIIVQPANTIDDDEEVIME